VARVLELVDDVIAGVVAVFRHHRRCTFRSRFPAKDALIEAVVAYWLRSRPAGERREANDRRQDPDDGDHGRRAPPSPELGVADRLRDGTVAVDADQDQVENGRGAQQDVGGQPQVAEGRRLSWPGSSSSWSRSR